MLPGSDRVARVKSSASEGQSSAYSGLIGFLTTMKIIFDASRERCTAGSPGHGPSSHAESSPLGGPGVPVAGGGGGGEQPGQRRGGRPAGGLGVLRLRRRIGDPARGPAGP